MNIINLTINNKKIEYSIEGNGKTVVLLHGYMESLHIWEELSDFLKNEFRVICIDLPGHGNSDNCGEVNSMECMAETVNTVLENQNIEKCFIVGHSMGGYVTLSFVEKYPEKVESFCLFHSSPFADDESKKAVREQTVDLIKGGKKIPIAKAHVEKTFAQENTSKFVQEIGFLKVIAVNTKDEGIIASLEGMKNRKDHFQTIKNFKNNFLWILGKKDEFISLENIKKLSLPDKCELVVLENSGHQGLFEEKEKSFDILYNYLKKI